MIVIQHKNQLVPTTSLLDVVYLGDNPTSGMIRGDVLVLCKGVYNPNNTGANTESSFHKIFPNQLNVFL